MGTGLLNTSRCQFLPLLEKWTLMVGGSDGWSHFPTVQLLFPLVTNKCPSGKMLLAYVNVLLA
jgi:hypothetical protein